MPGHKRGFAEVDSEAKDAVRKLQRFARGGDPNDRLYNLKMLLNMENRLRVLNVKSARRISFTNTTT